MLSVMDTCLASPGKCRATPVIEENIEQMVDTWSYKLNQKLDFACFLVGI